MNQAIHDWLVALSQTPEYKRTVAAGWMASGHPSRPLTREEWARWERWWYGKARPFKRHPRIGTMVATGALAEGVAEPVADDAMVFEPQPVWARSPVPAIALGLGLAGALGWYLWRRS